MCIQYRRIHGVDDLMISSGIMVPGERSLLHLGSATKYLEKLPLEHAASAVAGSFSLRKKSFDQPVQLHSSFSSQERAVG